MTTAPGTREDVEVRSADRADLLAVKRIENASFPQPWPYDAFERYLDAPGFLVAVEATPSADGGGGETLDAAEVVGFVVADLVPNHGEGLGHVKDLAVHPERRGDGVGESLLAAALGTLSAHSAASVKLEVRESNDPARELYGKFGFQPLRRVPRYYDDGEDALILVREIR